jgi:hypothetical protein
MHTVAAPTPVATADPERRRIVDWGARAAVATPLIALFAIGVGAPLYADDLSDAASTGRFVVAGVATLALLLLLALALVSFYMRGERRLGAAGHAGFLVALAGTILATGGAWDSLFAVPYIADEAPAVLDKSTGGSLLAGFFLSYLTFVVGWVLFAVASLRARLAPRGVSIALIACSVVAILPAPTPLRLLPLTVAVALGGRAVLRERDA